MRLNLSEIINIPGGSVPFDYEFDLSDVNIMGSSFIQEPVRVWGEVRNYAGILEVKGSLETNLHCVCDRCAKEFQRVWHYDFTAILEEDIDDESEDTDIFPLDGDYADIDDIASTMFVLNMDTKFLCTPDCKGLCERCGADLNNGPCDCEKPVDPRLAVLAQLLEEE